MSDEWGPSEWSTWNHWGNQGSYSSQYVENQDVPFFDGTQRGDRVSRWQDLYDGLVGLEREILKAEVRAARQGARDVERYAQQTWKYNDETGATRASTVAFVKGFTRDDRIAEAEAIASQLNPGYAISAAEAVELYEGDESGNQIEIVLTTGTIYTIYLETARGGQNAFLVSTLAAEYSEITETINRFVSNAIERYDAKTARARAHTALDPDEE